VCCFLEIGYNADVVSQGGITMNSLGLASKIVIVPGCGIASLLEVVEG
jgi:hypothetical protein